MSPLLYSLCKSTYRPLYKANQNHATYAQIWIITYVTFFSPLRPTCPTWGHHTGSSRNHHRIVRLLTFFIIRLAGSKKKTVTNKSLSHSSRSSPSDKEEGQPAGVSRHASGKQANQPDSELDSSEEDLPPVHTLFNDAVEDTPSFVGGAGEDDPMDFINDDDGASNVISLQFYQAYLLSSLWRSGRCPPAGCR